jgi:hypothetical protein
MVQPPALDPALLIRHRLDQLGYSSYQKLGDINLLQRLVSDLVDSSEAAREFKAKSDLSIIQADSARAQVSHHQMILLFLVGSVTRRIIKSNKVE